MSETDLSSINTRGTSIDKLNSVLDHQSDIYNCPFNRKRKRDLYEADDDLESTIHAKFIRPPSSPVERQLNPLFRLPRCCVPLGALQAGWKQPDFFESSEPNLEAVSRNNDGSGRHCPSVLVVKVEDNGRLGIIEKIGIDLYSVSELANWMTMEEMGRINQLEHTCCRTGHDGYNTSSSASWWGALALDMNAIEESGKNHAFRPRPPLPFAMVSLLGAKTRGAENSSIPSTSSIAESISTVFTAQSGSEQQTDRLQELFGKISNQYLDMLYLSKTPLAYFAKGPLSRARAAILSDDNCKAKEEIIAYLRSLTLSVQAMEKKYREAIPEIVATISGKTPKRKRRKKSGAGKNGIFYGEEDYTMKWFASQDTDEHYIPTFETLEFVFQQKLDQLRIRETQLQIMIILEILALEPLSSGMNGTAEMIESSKHEQQSEGQPTRKRKDLKLSLELYIDRLCIWQSVEPDDVLRTGNDLQPSQADSPHSRSKEINDINPHRRDELKTFCTDVIVPFFAARLPDHCASMVQKLTGFSASSPPKPVIERPATSSRLSFKDGTRPVKTSASRPSKTQTKLDKSSKGIRPHGSRSLREQSASLSVPNLKRERSETPHFIVPGRGLNVAVGNRVENLKAKRFAQREVDLTTVSSSKETNTARKAGFEDELKAAISVLKKPNRSLAVREYADSADHRTVLAEGNAKRSGKVIKGRSQRSVQVTATPRSIRSRTLVNATPSKSRPFPNPQAVPDLRHPSSPPSVLMSTPGQVPDSNTPLNAYGAGYESKQTAISEFRKSMPNIQDTPSRRSIKTANPSFFERGESLPAMASKPVVGSTNERKLVSNEPPKHVELTSQQKVAINAGTVFATPVKSALRTVGQSPVMKMASAERYTVGTSPAESITHSYKAHEEKSIYESLGWDNEVDELA